MRNGIGPPFDKLNGRLKASFTRPSSPRVWLSRSAKFNAIPFFRQQAKESLPEVSASSNITSPATATNPGVAHYICPNDCEGSGGDSAGTCPVCGSEYTHNQAYHNNPTASTPAITPPPGTPPGAPADPNPAQNAAGVYHYTCEKGCAGGAGGPGTCNGCGGALAHNQAYHNL